MWWWDPFGAAVFAFSGFPAAGFDHPVFCGTRQGEVVDVGLAAVGPIGYRVVDLAVGPAHGAAGAGTAAVSGEQHDSLVGRGDAPGAPEVQCTAGVFVEDGQVVVGVAGQLDDGRHRQQASGGGDGLPAAGFQLLQGGGDDDGGRQAVVLSDLTRR